MMPTVSVWSTHSVFFFGVTSNQNFGFERISYFSSQANEFVESMPVKKHYSLGKITSPKLKAFLQARRKSEQTRKNMTEAIWEGRDGEDALRRKSVDLESMNKNRSPQASGANTGRVIGVLKGDEKDKISPTNLVTDLPLLARDESEKVKGTSQVIFFQSSTLSFYCAKSYNIPNINDSNSN